MLLLVTHHLSAGEKEKTFTTTLNTVEMIIHVEEGDSNRKAGNHDTLHLASGPRVANNNGDDDHLNDSQLGDRGSLETNLHILDLLGGLGFEGFGITGHFIIY